MLPHCQRLVELRKGFKGDGYGNHVKPRGVEWRVEGSTGWWMVFAQYDVEGRMIIVGALRRAAVGAAL
jgi:hypothetical protein